MHSPARWLLPLLAYCPLVCCACSETDDYRVRIDAKLRYAEVRASLCLHSDTLSMFDVEPVPGLPNGHFDLVEDLQIRDAHGSVLDAQNLGSGDLRVAGDQRITLQYRVRLEHARYTWPAGLEEVAYHTDEGLLIGGSRLFFVDGEVPSQQPIRVRFELPRGWQAHTPWPGAAQPMQFLPESRRDLLNNVVFLGTAHAQTFEADGIRIELVLGQRYRAQAARFIEILRTQLHSYTELFQGPPRTRRYLIVINEGASGDGGAFAGSFSQYIAGDADRLNEVNWAHTLAHELLHFWNGLSLVPADPREEWFKEGVTDYLTIATMARNGLIDQTLLMKRLENLARRYRMARMLQGTHLSLRAAGADKQRQRMLIYGGGALVALALDARLREVSEDRLSLASLMAAMHQAYGQTGQPYTLADIERLARTLSGVDFHDFFAASVDSTDELDLRASLRSLGLRLDSFMDEAYIAPDPAADPAAQRRFREVFVPG
ncbi:MAG: hypothetical protein U1F26_12440 [Lysobacterales bacterium]